MLRRKEESNNMKRKAKGNKEVGSSDTNPAVSSWISARVNELRRTDPQGKLAPLAVTKHVNSTVAHRVPIVTAHLPHNVRVARVHDVNGYIAGVATIW